MPKHRTAAIVRRLATGNWSSLSADDCTPRPTVFTLRTTRSVTDIAELGTFPGDRGHGRRGCCYGIAETSLRRVDRSVRLPLDCCPPGVTEEGRDVLSRNFDPDGLPVWAKCDAVPWPAVQPDGMPVHAVQSVMPYFAATSCASEAASPVSGSWEAPAVTAASAAFWMLVADCTSFPISIARATKPNVAVSATVQRTRMTPSSRLGR